MDRMMDADEFCRMIASAKAGDPAGYVAILDAYGPRLYAYFLRATGSHHDAEDLLSDLMFRLLRRLKGYDERGRFESWLFRIAANMVRDRIRRIRAAPAVLSLSAKNDAGQTLAEGISGDAAPDEAMLAAEANDRLNAALAKLDEPTRRMILLRHYGRMCFRELADLFDCPLGTALARVHRGLRTLRQWMGSDDGTG